MATRIRQQHGLDSIRPYVPGKPIEEVQREYGLTDVIKLASNENPLGTSPKVLAAIRAELESLNFYPDAMGYDVCHAISKWIGVDFEQVIVGNGADGIIRQVCTAYLEDGDEVIVSSSSFPVYDISTQVMRAKLVKTPLNEGYGLDLEAMGAAISDKTKLIFVCNPNNPTGTIVTASELAAFMAKVPERVVVVLDEAYYEFVDSSDYPQSLPYVRESRKNVLVLRTFSKIYGMAGLRLGFGVAASELLAPLHACRESFPINRLAQAAGIAALDDAEFLQKTVKLNDDGRKYLYREFERLGLYYVRSHTNFILVRVGPEAKAVIEGLLRRGVIVRPCFGYDLPQFVRITVGTPPQNERLIVALGAVLEGLGSKQPA